MKDELPPPMPDAQVIEIIKKLEPVLTLKEGKFGMVHMPAMLVLQLASEVEAARRYQKSKVMIHIAGHPVQIGPMQRQLCAWCGVSLIAHDLRLVASVDGKPPAAFPQGVLVRVEHAEHGKMMHALEPDGSDTIPGPNCIFEDEQEDPKPRPKLTLVPKPKAGDEA